jgi:hypothetical protein
MGKKKFNKIGFLKICTCIALIITFSVVIPLLYSISTVYPFIINSIVTLAILTYALLDYILLYAIINFKYGKKRQADI